MGNKGPRIATLSHSINIRENWWRVGTNSTWLRYALPGLTIPIAGQMRTRTSWCALAKGSPASAQGCPERSCFPCYPGRPPGKSIGLPFPPQSQFSQSCCRKRHHFHTLQYCQNCHLPNTRLSGPVLGLSLVQLVSHVWILEMSTSLSVVNSGQSRLPVQRKLRGQPTFQHRQSYANGASVASDS